MEKYAPAGAAYLPVKAGSGTGLGAWADSDWALGVRTVKATAAPTSSMIAEMV